MLVTEECIVSIKNEIYHLIGSTNFETITVPINCHFFGCHSVKHEILEVLECVSHLCFCHVYTIHDFDPCAYFVCRLCNRPPAADSVSVTFLQQMWIILLNFLNKFIYTVLL